MENPGPLMVRRLFAAALVVFCGTALVPPSIQTASAATVPALDHVFVIVMENHSYDEIVGSASAPFLNSLSASGSLASNYYGVTHPSVPNYLALTGGSTYGISTDCTTCWISAANIGDSIEGAGKSWKAYMESMPAPCYIGDSYPYMQKHDPFVYFNDIRTNTARCQGHVVPYSAMSSAFSRRRPRRLSRSSRPTHATTCTTAAWGPVTRGCSSRYRRS
jgi:phosphoesterase family protein